MESSPIYLKGNFWKRLLAFIIDEILLIILLFVFFFILALINIKTEGLEDVIFLVSTFIYNFVFIYKSGATIGKKLLKLKVVSTDYKPVSFKQAFLRESIGKMISSSIANLGYLNILRSPQRQGWHDKLFKTFVVAIDNEGKLIPVPEETVSKKDKLIYWITFAIEIIALIFPFLFIIFFLFFAQPQQIKGQAMSPNYMDGQFYFTDKISYRVHGPKRGDVIVFKAPDKPNTDYFKRIIGLPDEEVEIITGKVYIDRQALPEPYLKTGTVTYTYPGGFVQEGQKITISQDKYFVLGDNRGQSIDSREFGLISKENIIGKLTICYWNCSAK